MINNRIATPDIWVIARGNSDNFFGHIGKPEGSIGFDEVKTDAATVQELHVLGKSMQAILPRDAALPAFSIKFYKFDGSMPDILNECAQPKYSTLCELDIDGIEATFASDGNNSVICKIELAYSVDGGCGYEELGICMFFTESLINGFSIGPLSIKNLYGQNIIIYDHESITAICDYLAFVWNGIQHRIANRPEVVKTTARRIRCDSKIMKKKESPREHIVKVERLITLTIDETEAPVVEIPPRVQETTARLWGVAGHYRTCTSGKRIWIKPHLKGKDRLSGGEYCAKNYRFCKEGNQ
jgi:hypothetical protein